MQTKPHPLYQAHTLPSFIDTDLVDRPSDPGRPARLQVAEIQVIGAFASFFIGRHVYDLPDPRDHSPCHGILRSVGDHGIVVAATAETPASRQGPPAAHWKHGLTWAALSTATRAERLAVLSPTGAETNAAAALAAATGLEITGRDGQPARNVRPGPVLLTGATVYVADLPYPIYAVAAGLTPCKAAYEALAQARRRAREFMPAPAQARTARPEAAPVSAGNHPTPTAGPRRRPLPPPRVIHNRNVSTRAA